MRASSLDAKVQFPIELPEKIKLGESTRHRKVTPGDGLCLFVGLNDNHGSLTRTINIVRLRDQWKISEGAAAVERSFHKSMSCHMKDLLAVVAPVSEPKLGWSVDYGLDLARLIGAHFTAMIADIDTGSSPGQVAPDDIHNSAETTKPIFAAPNFIETAALIESAAARIDVPCTVLSHDNASRPLRETLIENTQVRDLTILDVCGPLRHPRKGLVEAALFNTGRPIVLVPTVAPHLGVGTVVIAWDETPSAVRALHDALPLLTQARDVVLISVTGDKEFRTFRSGADLCQYLARWEIIAHVEVVERGGLTVGAALLERARRIEADLLVMGGFGHAKEREFIVGSATRDIFQSNLEIPVLLSH